MAIEQAEINAKPLRILVGKVAADLAKESRTRLYAREQQRTNKSLVRYSYKPPNNLQSHAEGDHFNLGAIASSPETSSKNCLKKMDLVYCIEGRVKFKRFWPDRELHGFGCGSNRLSCLPASF